MKKVQKMRWVVAMHDFLCFTHFLLFGNIIWLLYLLPVGFAWLPVLF